MHFTDADGYLIVGTERHFINRNLPTYQGTIVDDEWLNAIQGELASIIEYAGLTLRTTGAADSAAGWDQAMTAIFNSAAITDAGISDVSVSKLTAGIASIGNSTIIMEGASPQISIRDTETSSVVTIEKNYISIYDDSIPSVLTLSDGALWAWGPSLLIKAEYGFNGIKFLGTGDPSEDKTISYRTAETRYPGTSHSWQIWTSGATSIGYTASGLETNFNLGDQSSFTGATMRYLNQYGEAIIVPVMLQDFYNAGSGKLGCKIRFASVVDATYIPDKGTERIYITYDGNIL